MNPSIWTIWTKCYCFYHDQTVPWAAHYACQDPSVSRHTCRMFTGKCTPQSEPPSLPRTFTLTQRTHMGTATNLWFMRYLSRKCEIACTFFFFFKIERWVWGNVTIKMRQVEEDGSLRTSLKSESPIIPQDIICLCKYANPALSSSLQRGALNGRDSRRMSTVKCCSFPSQTRGFAALLGEKRGEYHFKVCFRAARLCCPSAL